MINQNTPIKVYNHNTSDIGLAGQLREYLLNGSRGIPTVLTMPFSEVEYINSRSPVFRTGALQFAPKDREEIYTALNLDNWRDTVLFDEEIDRIIKEADIEGLEKFLQIKDVFTIQRVRGRMIALSNDNNLDISKRVIDLIEGRCEEINRGIRETKIQSQKAKARMQSDEDPRILKMQQQMAEMQRQMEAMIAANAKKSSAKRSVSKTSEDKEKTSVETPET